MNTDQLHDVLARAAGPVPRPDLARTALESAARERRRRRGIGAGLACAAAVVVAVVGVRVLAGAPAPVVEPPVTTPTGYVPPALPPVAPDQVRPTLDPDSDHPDERRFALPGSFAPTDVQPGPSGPAVAAVQLDDGSLYVLDLDRQWHAVAGLPAGRLFPESLARDGGALAVRGEDALEVRSLFADRTFSYEVDPVATTGLWANDSVGLFYDVPGPGGQVRDHEGPRVTDSVAFPRGDDLTDVAMDPLANTLVELDDDEIVFWSNFQDIGIARDTSALGTLERPIVQDGTVAAVRSGAGGSAPTSSDGVVVIGPDLATEALLPVAGVGADEVVLHDFVHEDTLLLQVGDRLFTWSFRDGEIRDVATLPPGAAVSFAYDNLQWWPR